MAAAFPERDHNVPRPEPPDVGAIKFTIPLKINRGVCKFSPNGEYLVSAFASGLEVRELKKPNVVHRIACIDFVDNVEWSPNSEFVLCVIQKRTTVQVWSLSLTEWICKINEGSLGCIDASWAPDGHYILTVSKLNLRISIWSLMNNSVSYIKYVKTGCKCFAFSPNGDYLAVIQRHELEDSVTIFTCGSWKTLKRYPIMTRDAREIFWSPDGQAMGILESLTEKVNLVFYSLDGSVLFCHCNYKSGLGVKSYSWSPTSQLLAMGTYHERVLILNYASWKRVLQFGYPRKIHSHKIVIYKAMEMTTEDQPTSNELGKYEKIDSRPVIIPVVEPDLLIPRFPVKQGATGVGKLKFSTCGHFLATVNDNMPTVIWIWDFNKLNPTDILLHSHPIKNLAWSTHRCMLFIATGTDIVYAWTPDCCMAMRTPFPESFAVNSLHVHPLEDSVILMGKGQMSLLLIT